MAFDLAAIALPKRKGPVGLLDGILRVTLLSPLHVLRGRRLIALALFAALPPALILLVRTLGTDDAFGPEVYRDFISSFYLHGLFPLTCLFLGAAAIGDDIDDGTVLYLRLRPVPRAAIVFGRFLAAVLCALVLFIPSIIALYLLLIGGSGSEFIGRYSDLCLGAVIAATLSSFGYCALFLLLGLLTRRAVIFGIVIALIQDVLLAVPGAAAWFSINLYANTALDHYNVANEEMSSVLMRLDDAGFAPTYHQAIFALVSASIVLLVLASMLFSSREYFEKPGE